MFRIGLLQTKYQNSSMLRPFFTTETERNNYFINQVDLYGTWSNAVNITLNDNISMDIVIDRDIADITTLLRYNYIVIEYPNAGYRYFFANLTQDSGGQVNAHLELDDYTQNYINIKNGVIANVKRATLPVFSNYKGTSTTNFSTGSDSLINISEGVYEPKIKSLESNLSLVKKNGYIKDIFDNTTWLYYFIKPNKILDLTTYRSDDISIECNVVVVPNGVAPFRIELRDAQGNITYKYWNKFYLENIILQESNVDIINANQDLLRILENSGVPTATTNITTNLSPYIISIKESPYPPFAIYSENGSYNFTYEEGFITLSEEIARNEGLGLYADGDTGFLTYLVRSDNNRQYPLFSDFFLGDRDFTKLYTPEFRELRLVSYKGDYITLDITKMEKKEFLEFVAIEKLTPDTTDTYIYLKDNGYFYKFDKSNYKGLLYNYDTTVPLYIDSLSSYFAANKNIVQQNELSRQSAQKQTEEQIKRSNKKNWADALSISGIVTSVTGLGSNQINRYHDNQLLQRSTDINNTNNAMQEAYNYENLEYAPPQMSGTGNIIFNKYIFNTLLPRLDYYVCDIVTLDKWISYFNKFGNKIGKIYTNLNIFDNLENLDYKYIQLDLLSTNAPISDEELRRIKVLLSQGILREVTE